MDTNTIILSCVAGYMLLCLVIGLWAMKRTKNTHDFFMEIGFLPESVFAQMVTMVAQENDGGAFA